MRPTNHPDVDSDLVRDDHRVTITVLAGLDAVGRNAIRDRILAAEPPGSVAVFETSDDELNAEALLELLDRDHPDQLVLETDDLAEPLAIAVALRDGPLAGRVVVGNIVTVVDGSRFWLDYERELEGTDDDGNPVIVPLAVRLVEQIEQASVVLLTNTGELDDVVLAGTEGYLRNLNPEAEVRRTDLGAVDVAWLLGTNRYGQEALDDPPSDAEPADADPEVDRFGFNSFVYAPERPFVWDAFVATLEEWPDEVMRCRGFVDFADHPPALLSMVRDTCELTVLEGAEGDDHDHDGHHDHDHDHTGHDHGQSGDEEVEGTELVFIGRGMPADAIVARLDACLWYEGMGV